MEQILFSRHLNEVDDLETYGRDAPLAQSEENLNRLNDITDLLYKKITEKHKKAVLFVTSPRIRAIETANLVAKNITEKSDSKVKVRFSVNEELKATEQGDFVLPDNYKAGETLSSLKLAGKIFDKETHGSDNGDFDNIDYRFGDPIEVNFGEYKYPELVGEFTEFGESYRETLIRIYSTLVDTSLKYSSFLNNTEVVVVAHGQTYHVFRGLTKISEMIKSNQIEFKTGDSIKLLWSIYKKCSDDEKTPGICMPLDLGDLSDPRLVELLQEEIKFLKIKDEPK